MEILSFDDGIKPKEHYKIEFDTTHVCLNCGIKFGQDYIVNIEVIGKDSSSGSDPLELTVDSQTECPKCGYSSRYMGGKVFLCDNMMADTILILNKAGYKTHACCAGHCYIFGNRFSICNAYISFADLKHASELYEFAEKKEKSFLFNREQYLGKERAVYAPSSKHIDTKQYQEFVGKYNGKLLLIDNEGYTTNYILSDSKDITGQEYSVVFETQEDAVEYLKAWNKEVEELVREFCK